MDDIRIENFMYPYVRFLNACPSLAGADFYLGNSLASPSLGFGCFSGYVKVPIGMNEFKITKANDKNNVVATITLPFKQGEVYTIAAVHSDGSTMAYGIAEPVCRENTKYGHLRVCHLSPLLGKLDISANGYELLEDIDYLELSKYMCLSQGKYEFSFFDSKSPNALFVMPNQNLLPGKYNTLYVVGNGSEKAPHMGLLSVDAASYTGYYL